MRYSIRTLIPILAVVTLMAACNDDDDIGPNLLTGRVRFANLVPNSGNLLLTANNIAVGSSQAFGTASLTCSNVTTGLAVPLATGTPNAAGTGIANTLATTSANITANGNFTVLAVGPANATQLVFLNNATTAPTGSNAAVRFVNAASGTGGVDVFLSPNGTTLTTPVATNIQFGTSGSAFITIPAQTAFVVFTRTGTTERVFTSPTAQTFSAGQVATDILAPGAEGAGFQLVTLGGC